MSASCLLQAGTAMPSAFPAAGTVMELREAEGRIPPSETATFILSVLSAPLLEGCNCVPTLSKIICIK